jgi:hypothetical protein
MIISTYSPIGSRCTKVRVMASFLFVLKVAGTKAGLMYRITFSYLAVSPTNQSTFHVDRNATLRVGGATTNRSAGDTDQLLSTSPTASTITFAGCS